MVSGITKLTISRSYTEVISNQVVNKSIIILA